MRINFIALLALPVLIAPAALAHHSHAMFDQSQEVTIDGTVSNYVFSNPHAFLYVDVAEESGETVEY